MTISYNSPQSDNKKRKFSIGAGKVPLQLSNSEKREVSGRTHLGGQVFQYGSGVDGCGGSDASVGCGAALEMTMDAAHGELCV